MHPTDCTLKHPQISGEIILEEYNMDFLPLYADFLVIFGMVVVFQIATYIALRIKAPRVQQT